MRKLSPFQRFACSAICMLIFAFVWVPVSGDSLWEPREDTYFERHWGECDILPERYYQADGKDGTITLWKQPNGRLKIAEYQNGTEFRVIYLCPDNHDVLWTVVEDYVDTNGFGETQREYFSGWIIMSDLLVIYDHFSFVEEHENELKEFNGSIDLRDLHKFVYWQYPGSKKVNQTWFYDFTEITEEDVEFPYEFYGAGNHPWVYVEVHSGKIAKGWINLDNPFNDEIRYFH